MDAGWRGARLAVGGGGGGGGGGAALLDQALLDQALLDQPSDQAPGGEEGAGPSVQAYGLAAVQAFGAGVHSGPLPP